ncbi:UDP-N-acetylmuramoyl-L-alanine--D-glutamate ligase [Carnobacteriaceae bacterium zg-ZUI252]|nr:UDP-N-acetylmuramoyl-L-alanine--D-glutamate ligase [Carnobacteriaceae bacterium zg-ZUI252]QTU83621.1 UDP-N-acetylmuramoyl-L-alanine--D-glutamate ligase [Carnobacteriaceae bacterium zg-C25]
MKVIEQFKSKKVVVLGLARSGYNAALLLQQLGAIVVVNDGKTPEDLTHVKHLESLGVTVITGHHPDDLIDETIDYVVKNPGIPYENSVVKQAQQHDIPILTDVELAYLVSQAPIISITGSNGKTTTTTLIANMLENHPNYERVLLAGNIGVPSTTVAQNATENDMIVMEMSSFQLMGIKAFRPKIAVIVNIFEAHLDYHHTREAYVEAKLNLLKNQTNEDYLVLNGDIAESFEFAKRTQAKVHYFSKANTQCSAYVQDEWVYVLGEPIFPVSAIQVPGTHNLENVLAATLVAKLSGQTNDKIHQSVSVFYGVEHRCQFVKEVDGRRFYNDSKATNILATQMALRGFEKPVLLIAGGLDRGNGFEALIPDLVKVKKMFVYGQTKEKLVQLANQQSLEVYAFESLDEATYAAFEKSSKEDIILLSPACASWDQFDSFEKRGERFVEIVETIKS